MNNSSSKKFVSLLAIFILCITVFVLILRTFLFSKLIPISLHITTFVIMFLTYVSARVWIKKVPDIKKRENQFLNMIRICSIFALIILVGFTLCALLILLLIGN